MSANEPYADIRDMYMIHTMFRREFGQLPDLVRAVVAGDGQRAQVVADHLQLLSDILIHHHHAEDDILWPLLLDRAPASEVDIVVGLMAAQHAEIDEIHALMETAATKWLESSAREGSDALIGALGWLIPELIEHTLTEERLVLPLAARYLKASEWNQIAQRGAAAIPPEKLLLAFGMVAYEADADVVEAVLSGMPPEIGSGLREFAPKAYAEYAVLVHGTDTPARSDG